MILRALPVTVVAAVLAAAPVAAHHSFAVHFVADKLVTVHGKVDEFTFRNPHGVLMLPAEGDGDLVRIVHLDGRPLPPATAPHSRAGQSVGRWDGETLVVDTTHLTPGTFMNNGFNHSEALKMTEQFRLSRDGNVLWLVQTYEDSAVFEGNAARYMAWTRRPGEYVYPYDCDPSYGE